MGRATARQRGYTPAWDKARASFLERNPWCAYCAEAGRRVTATVVDHRTPHKGSKARFWDKANWQPLCAACHNGAKQREETAGRPIGCDESGEPRDPGHHWNR